MSAGRHFYCHHTVQHPAAVIANNNKSLDPRLEAGVKVYPVVVFSAFLFVILLLFLSVPKVFDVIDILPLFVFKLLNFSRLIRFWKRTMIFLYRYSLSSDLLSYIEIQTVSSKYMHTTSRNYLKLSEALK